MRIEHRIIQADDTLGESNIKIANDEIVVVIVINHSRMHANRQSLQTPAQGNENRLYG